MATEVVKGPMLHSMDGTMKRKTVQHELIRNQLNTLLENEIMYKKQIRQMNKASMEMTNAYDTLYDENKVLRSLVEHGPDTVKVAKLNDENGKLRRENQKLLSENKSLTSQIKRLEKQLSQPDEDELDKEWNEVLAAAKKRREQLDEAMKKARTSRSVKEKGVVKSSLLRSLEEEEEINLRIDSLEKEVYILQNNVKRMKTEWEHISFSRMKDKGNSVKNETVANAINEKLTRDIYRFELRLNKLRSKHSALKIEQGEFLKEEKLKVPEKVTNGGTSKDTGEKENNDENHKQESEAKSNKTTKPHKQNSSNPVSKLPRLATKLASNKRGTAQQDENPNSKSALKTKETFFGDMGDKTQNKGNTHDISPQQFSIHTRQELAELKAISRRQKWEELQAKKILPARLADDAKNQNIIRRKKYLRRQQREEFYKNTLNSSLDDISDDHTRSPIPIEFKEIGNYLEHDEVRLILKRWDRPVYETVQPWH